jgi:hypothetical protein
MNTYPIQAGFKERGATSEAAAKAIEPTCARLGIRVLQALREHPRTADEVAETIGETILAVRPRVSQLYRQGIIRKSGDRRLNASGLGAHVWELVSAETTIIDSATARPLVAGGNDRFGGVD